MRLIRTSTTSIVASALLTIAALLIASATAFAPAGSPGKGRAANIDPRDRYLDDVLDVGDSLILERFGIREVPAPSKLVRTRVGAANTSGQDDDRDVWPNVRIYWPTGRGPHQVVVYVPGAPPGTDRQSRIDVARKIAATANAVVILVRMRTAPGLAATRNDDDGFAAYEWARSNAGALGGDPRRVAVIGEGSADLRPGALRVRERRTQPLLPILPVMQRTVTLR